MTMTPGDPRFRILYTVWGFIECLVFGGLLYGWASLVYVLKEEGFYLELCPSVPLNVTTLANATAIYNLSDRRNATELPDAVKTDGKCDERDAKLHLAFTIAMAVFCIGCFIMGQVNFKFGIRITRIAAAIIFITGSLMLAFMSKDAPDLLYPGLSLIGTGGMTYLVTNMQLSVLFPKGGSAVVGLMCGGFDASSGVQLLVKIGYENGISRQTSYIVLACTHVLTFVSTFLFLPKKFIEKPSAINDDIHDKEAAIELTGSTTTEKEEQSKPSLKSCMFSLIYIFHVLWLSILQLRFYFLLGSLNKTLEILLNSDEEAVSQYTVVFMFILMCGLFTSPLAGATCDFFSRVYASNESIVRRTLMPFVIPLTLTTTLCAILSVLILTEIPAVQYAVFVFVLLFRSFMYTVAAGFIGAIFPSEYFGIMYGILIITGGIISMLQYPLFTWSDAGGLWQVNLFLTVLIIVTLGHPFYLWITCLKAETSGSFLLMKS